MVRPVCIWVSSNPESARDWIRRMCGICGVVGEGAHTVAERMLGSIRHRGPDDQGIFFDPAIPVSLGVRRLSIIDVVGGRQPIANETATVHAVFNGEIYNYRELRQRLERRSHRFATNTDTEVIVHLYEDYGPACVHALRGMFAFAVWDAPLGRLFVARDRLGKKPLYYRYESGRLQFASEIKAILEDPSVPREVDNDALALYLALGFVPSPRTMFAGIYKLPAGHTLTLDQRGVHIEPYWDVPFLDQHRPICVEDAVEELRERLEEAVRLRLMADVPLGALLSGGIDSGGIVAMMASAGADPIRTYTVGFDVGGWHNEFEGARSIARHFSTDHHETVLSAHDVPELMEKVVWHLDEPLADPAALPTYLISMFARQHVTVVLTGEGGDELFGGYPRYRWWNAADSISRRVPALARHALLNVGARLPEPARRRAMLLLADRTPAERHLDWVGVLPWSVRKQLTHLEDGTDRAAELVTEVLQAGPAESMIHSLMYLDFKTWLADDILMKVDKMSMAASLEARAPLLDHKLVEFMCTLPPELKVSGRTTKWLLKQALADALPPATINRRKHPFRVPLESWFRGHLSNYLSDNLLAPDARIRRYLDPTSVDRLVREHLDGDHNREQGLWMLLSFELWHRAFVG